MSHPPETSLSSRELTEQIHKILGIEIYNLETNEPWREIATLIDAWVRVREAQERSLLLKRFYHWIESNLPVDLFEGAAKEFGQYSEEEAALATARKRLGEKVK